MREAALYLRTRYGSIGFLLPTEAEKKHIAFAALDSLELTKVYGTRCWTYARTDCGGETAIALNAQAMGLKSYAKEQNWTLEGSTCEAMPGGSLDRAGLREVLSAAQAGKMDILLVHSLSRLYRGQELYGVLEFVNQLKCLGVQVVCLKERIMS